MFTISFSWDDGSPFDLKLVELHSNSKDEIIEKQQKLLKLYKEYYELDRMYVKNNFFLELENLNRRSEIVEQIKELEKELENDK